MLLILKEGESRSGICCEAMVFLDHFMLGRFVGDYWLIGVILILVVWRWFVVTLILLLAVWE